MKGQMMIVLALLTFGHMSVWADTPKIDLIPELKDIEKIAAEQENAIRAQSEALKKAQQEKEQAEKAAKEAIEKQKMADTAPVNNEETKPVRKVAATTKPKHKTKTAQKAPAPVDPWLAQERRYSYP